VPLAVSASVSVRETVAETATAPSEKFRVCFESAAVTRAKSIVMNVPVKVDERSNLLHTLVIGQLLPISNCATRKFCDELRAIYIVARRSADSTGQNCVVSFF
jgi:hypothetical protein